MPVRAVLHAAFNVAVAVHCIDKGLPHPGFLVFDTPLLTYREPLKSKHGDLSDDEKALKATSLAEKFYKHLSSLEEKLQVDRHRKLRPADCDRGPCVHRGLHRSGR